MTGRTAHQRQRFREVVIDPSAALSGAIRFADQRLRQLSRRCQHTKSMVSNQGSLPAVITTAPVA
ncbi:hypothetical protein [Lactiplantibacillus plantarum]|uniref:hypothetical protein n=1 Tax=Lactiplantibacillus plantarum TaxID=1590 RepID=UPI000A71CCDD|nr:hypothetical protein [Lactiplantibacillus plantarum]